MEQVKSVKDVTQISRQLAVLSVHARNELNKGLAKIQGLYDSGDLTKQALYFTAAQDLFEGIANEYAGAAQTIGHDVLAAQGLPLKKVEGVHQALSAEGIIREALHSKNPKIYLEGAMDSAVKRGYRNAIADNAERYARVPSGGYTCPFCVMLAAKGFAYKKTAGAAHNYCDCVLVPGKKDTKIAGFDTEKLKELAKEGKGIGENTEGKEARNSEGERLPPSGAGDRFDEITGFKQGVPFEIEQALKGANGVPGEKNCQQCILAYELRRRGYDVSALGGVDGFDIITNGTEGFLGLSGQPAQFKVDYTKAELLERINAFSEGTRCSIYIQWVDAKDTHVFIAEREKIGIRFVDPQTNDVDVSYYFDRGVEGKYGYLRMNNLDINPDFDWLKVISGEIK